VARNDQFQDLIAMTAEQALSKGGNVESLLNSTSSNGKTLSENITNAVATIGENMSLRRITTLEVSQGVVATYVHAAVKPGMGKIGVLVALESAGKTEVLETLGKQIAMHVAAARPDALTRDTVDSSKLEREKVVLREQAIASGKPVEVIDKMIEGRIRKYYEEVVLLDQLFVMDGKTKISDVIAAAEKDAGAPIQLTAFERFALGEGIDKPVDDFAAEVAKTAGVA